MPTGTITASRPGVPTGPSSAAGRHPGPRSMTRSTARRLAPTAWSTSARPGATASTSCVSRTPSSDTPPLGGPAGPELFRRSYIADEVTRFGRWHAPHDARTVGRSGVLADPPAGSPGRPPRRGIGVVRRAPDLLDSVGTTHRTSAMAAIHARPTLTARRNSAELGRACNVRRGPRAPMSAPCGPLVNIGNIVSIHLIHCNSSHGDCPVA